MFGHKIALTNEYNDKSYKEVKINEDTLAMRDWNWKPMIKTPKDLTKSLVEGYFNSHSEAEVKVQL